MFTTGVDQRTIHLSLTVRLETSVEISFAAYQHPRVGPCAKLRSWQKICYMSHRSIDVSFPIDPKAAIGVLGYLILTLMDDIHITVLSGASRDCERLCIVLPLCEQPINKGSRCMSILRTFEKASGVKRLTSHSLTQRSR